MAQPSLLVVAPVAHATPKCVTNTRNALIIPMYSPDNADADCEADNDDHDDDEEYSVRPSLRSVYRFVIKIIKGFSYT